MNCFHARNPPVRSGSTAIRRGIVLRPEISESAPTSDPVRPRIDWPRRNCVHPQPQVVDQTLGALLPLRRNHFVRSATRDPLIPIPDSDHFRICSMTSLFILIIDANASRGLSGTVARFP